MKTHYILLAMVFSFAGCQNPKDGGGDLAGLATASALVVALPLIPFTETYHAINQTGEKEREKREYWMSVFEPVYSERTALISQRSPIDDAARTISAGIRPFITVSEPLEESRFGIYPVYPGLSRQQADAVDYHTNMKLIQSEEFTKYLWTLLSLDPLHEENEEARRYYSGTEIYNTFIKERYSYMQQFNQYIIKESNKALHSTPEAAPLP